MPVAASLVSASRRPLLLRIRADLITRQHEYLGRRYWVIKDPLSLKYYRFEEEEFAILQMLDGNTSLDEIQREFERRFTPQKIAAQELHQLIGMLHRASLIVSDAPGQGRQLLKRRREQVRREWVGRLANLLNMRFSAFDPDRLLTILNRYLGWFFSGPCLALAMVLGAAAALLVLSQFDTFTAKLPTFRDFFASRNWIWLALTLGITKVLHEFGHGLACKRFGGECHEMGVMLLVLAPCLYCNVSDSWMLPSKWQRAAIGAAGMYVELMLASVCTFLWWFSQPGLLNYLCLNVMLVSSVSTLLFNANPLLRYDGYYILSDLLEIPNLRQKADLILRRKLGRWAFGLPEQPDPFLPQRRQGLFAAYSVASAVYRWVVVFSIFFFLYQVFEPYRLKVVGQILAGMGLLGLVFQPAWQLAHFLSFPGRVDQVNKHRTAVAAIVLGVVLAAAFLVPLPHRVRCALYLQARDASAVYVESPGSLQQVHARPGDWVHAGQPLVTLANIDVQIAIERLLGEKQRVESRLEGLRRRAFEEETAAMEVGEVKKALTSITEQLEARQQDLQKLTLTAPSSGVLIAPPAVPPPPHDSGRLRTWSGTPYDDENLAAYLASGVPLGEIGNPHELEAILALDESDVEFLQPGQQVDLFLDQLPGRAFSSRIEQMSQVDMKITPRNVSSKAGGDLVSRVDSSGYERPLNTTYQANAWLNDDTGLLLVGATGEGKIYARPQTVAQRIWRYLCQTFAQ